MPSATAEILTIGTEILLGFTVDANAAFLGQALSAAGVAVARRGSVGDDPAAIRAALGEALDRAGLVITTGGLGPTRDDISRDVVADMLGLPLEFNPGVWNAILARYARFGRTPVASNRTQAMVPRGAVPLPNQWGTAPGLWIDSPRGTIIMLPGVPLEMRMLTEREVIPRLRSRIDGSVIRSATVRTCGIPESTLAERVADVEATLAPLTLAYLPSVDGVDLRVTCWGMAPAAADERLAAAIAALREAASEWVYGEGDTDLAAVVIDRLRRAGRKLAVAESCTGGLLGGRITSIPGSSDAFAGGIVSYANAAKESLLDVPHEIIAAHGAVSGETAEAMARGARAHFGADIAVAITGIAGPGGGSEAKPVGTVWFGLAHEGGTVAHRSVFGGDRNEIRARAVQGALRLLWTFPEARSR